MTTVVAYSGPGSPSGLGALDDPAYRTTALVDTPGMVTFMVSVLALLHERPAPLTSKIRTGGSDRHDRLMNQRGVSSTPAPLAGGRGWPWQP